MDIVISAEVPAKAEGGIGDAYRSGAVERTHLLADSAADGLNFRLFFSKYQPGGDAFQSPRHHHGFQQIRWTKSGSVNYGPEQNIEVGDIAYFPRGTYYGPQVKDQGVSLLLQYGFGAEMVAKKVEEYRQGAHIKDLKKSLDKLQETGRIVDGVYVQIDPATGEERRSDPGEALHKQLGTKLAIPPEGFATPILIHPRAFEFFQLEPGVEFKHLGRFFDHPGAQADLHLAAVRLSEERDFTLSAERAQIAWSLSDGLKIDGRDYPSLTFLYSPLGENSVITGQGGVEVMIVEFPRPNG